MTNHSAVQTRSSVLNFFLAAGSALAIASIVCLAGCGSNSKPAEQASAQQQAGPKRYQLEGRVVSVQPSSNQVVVDHKDIPGFMMGMTMPYPVKNPDELKPLAPEDQIKADVVVNGNDVYLENIIVTKKADQAKPPASSSAPAAPSDSKKDGPKL
jgi:Cu/Ag efflux protein CusF